MAQPCSPPIAGTVAAAPNPLRYDAAIRINAIEYAGHTLLTSLKILDPDPNDAPLLGVWSLTQMPHQGELVARIEAARLPIAGNIDVRKFREEEVNFWR